MPLANRNTPLATRYARSLLELANESQQTQDVADGLKGIAEIWSSNPTLAALAADPAVSEQRRAELLQRVFAGRVSPLLLNFLGVINAKGRLTLLPEMVAAYNDLLERQLGNVEVGVTVAQKLTPEQLEQVRQRISQSLNRNAIVTEEVDESIIGGLVLRIEDKLIDASVRQQLKAMKEQLLATARK